MTSVITPAFNLKTVGYLLEPVTLVNVVELLAAFNNDSPRVERP